MQILLWKAQDVRFAFERWNRLRRGLKLWSWLRRQTHRIAICISDF